MKQFRDIVRSQTFETDENQTLGPFEQVIALMRFFDKYDCLLALSILANILNERVQKNWPPLLLFLLGAQMNRPDLCMKALNAPARVWSSYPKMLPAGSRDPLGDDYCLHPFAMPYNVLRAMPVDYSVALSLTHVPHTISIHPDKNKRDLYGSSFMWVLESLRKQAATAK